MVSDPLDKLIVAQDPNREETSRQEVKQPDAFLWDEFRGGSEKAFSLMYEEHAKILLAYGKKLARSPRLVEDCLHDLFIELWDRKQHLSATDSIRLYLLKAFKHKLLRAMAKQDKLSFTSNAEDEQLGFVFSCEWELIHHQSLAEQEARLKTSVAGLSENQREIIFLRFYSGLSYEQIGEVMGIHYQSVKNLMFRAMQTLRKQLIFLFLSISFSALI